MSPTSGASVPKQFELLGRLEDADTPREVAAEIVRLAKSEPTCKRAAVLWELDGARDPQSEPLSQLALEDMALARSAALHAKPMYSLEGDRVAIRLFQAHPAVLLLTIASPADGQCFVQATKDALALAGRHLARALELVELRASLKRLERSETLQRALFAISDLAGSDRDMTLVLRGIHAIVGTLMYAENFIIVLHNAERDSVRFLYFADVADPEPPDPAREVPMHVVEHSLTWYLLTKGKPLMGNTEQLRAQVTGPLTVVGPLSQDWLGVPMLREGRARGAIVVQSYLQGIGYTAEDRTLLEFVGNHILIALERKQGKQDLEQRVRLRTAELAEANQVLQLEIVERQRAERLQKALFQIAELATADISQAEFYHRVHSVVGQLLNAQNFYIGLLSEDAASLEFPYYVDANRNGQQSRPLGRGLSEYVIRHGKPLLGMTADIDELARQDEIDLLMSGSRAVCWLGQPLFVGDATIGLITVQSYDPAVVYGPADQELLSFVASQVANSLYRRRAADSLRQAYAQLKQDARERVQ